MSKLFNVYCRAYQSIMKFAVNFLDWTEPELIKGEGAVKLLPAKIREKGLNSVLVVTDKGLMGLNLLDGLFKGLEETGINYVVYDGVQPNPTIDNIEAALELYKTNSCEGIVAFDKSRELLKRRGFAVMLESSEATSLGRIHNLSTRPLLAHDCDIEGLWEQRKPLYEEVARAKINVQGRSTGSVAGFVAKVLARAGVYTPDSEDAVAKKIEADSLKRHKKHRHSKSGRPRSAAERSNASHKGQKAAGASRESVASSKRHVAHASAGGQGAAEKADKKQNGSGASKHRRRRGTRGRGKTRASNNRQNGQRGATPPAN